MLPSMIHCISHPLVALPGFPAQRRCAPAVNGTERPDGQSPEELQVKRCLTQKYPKWWLIVVDSGY